MRSAIVSRTYYADGSGDYMKVTERIGGITFDVLYRRDAGYWWPIPAKRASGLRRTSK